MSPKIAHPMNQQKLIKEIVKETGCGNKEVQTIIKAAFEIMLNKLEEGDSISLKFGKLVPWHQTTRPARNPRTGEPVMLAPRTSVKFRAGKLLIKKLNK